MPFFMIGCQPSQTDSVKDFIPGTYVANINLEFSTGHDTLFIMTINASGNIYQLARSSSFIRKVDGIEFPVERKFRKWVATYNCNEKVLNETAHSAIISFSPDKNELYLGTRRYTKISNH